MVINKIVIKKVLNKSVMQFWLIILIKYNNKGENQKGDLYARFNSNINCQSYFIFTSYCNYYYILSSIFNNQEQDKTDESGGDSAACCNIIDAINYKLGIEGN